MTHQDVLSGQQELASLRVALERHPDLSDLERDFKVLLQKKHEGRFVDVVLLDRRMEKWRRRGIGGYLVVLGSALISALIWAWSMASQVMAAPATPVRAHFLGIGFEPTSEFCLVLIVMLAAMLGSVAVITTTFAARAGHETLERGYLWWYITRPLTGAAVGLLFYVTVVAGFFDASTSRDRPALIVAAAIGGLAGLFTDQVVKKMRAALGLLPSNQPASGKSDED